MIKFKIMKYFNYIIIVGLTCGIISSVASFLVFYNNIETLGGENEWKFYASLVGFSILFMLFLSVIIAIIVLRFIRHKFNNNRAN